MRENYQRDAILNIQRYLRTLSYHDSRIPAPPVDGIYDDATRRSVEAFQAAEGLPVTGVVDKETLDELFDEYTDILREKAPPVPISHFPRISPGYTLREGDENFLVRLIQYALSELEMLYGEPVLAPQTGVYDEATMNAVRDFQARHFLPVTGEVDRATWDALASTYNRVFDESGEE